MAMEPARNDSVEKLKQYGGTALLAVGGFALVSFLRSESGRNRMQTLMGGQFANIEGQIQTALSDNMPMIEEAVDKLAETIQQGVSSINDEIVHYAEEIKARIREYATVSGSYTEHNP